VSAPVQAESASSRISRICQHRGSTQQSWEERGQERLGFKIGKTRLKPGSCLSPAVGLKKPLSLSEHTPPSTSSSQNRAEETTFLGSGEVNCGDSVWYLVGVGYTFPMINFRFGGSQPWLRINTTLLGNRLFESPREILACVSGVDPRHFSVKKDQIKHMIEYRKVVGFSGF
jgi:hypothetical protein